MIKKMKENHHIYGWGFTLPSIIFFATFFLYPIIQSLILVFTSSQGSVSNFVGLANFTRVLKDPIFWNSLKNSFLYLIVQVPIMLFMAAILAVLLNSKNLKFKNFFRLSIFLPSVTSLVSYSILFKMMFSENGIINDFLVNGIGFLDLPISWLQDPFWAKIVIIIALLWRWTGYNMLFYLSALQNINEEIYEAARIDGANVIQQFRYITLPLLKPIILFTAIQSTISTIQLFDEPLNITNGGPANSTMTVSMYIYKLGFEYLPNFGYAATVSYIVMLIIVVLSIIQFRVGEDKK